MAETFLIIHFVSLEMTETFINGSVRFFFGYFNLYGWKPRILFTENVTSLDRFNYWKGFWGNNKTEMMSKEGRNKGTLKLYWIYRGEINYFSIEDFKFNFQYKRK